MRRPAENHVVRLTALATSIAVSIALPDPRLDLVFSAAWNLTLSVAARMATYSGPPPLAPRVGLHQVSGAIFFDPRVHSGIGPSELLHFSFVTLATVGHGDAFPVSSAGRALWVIESMVGVL